jgi:hypothetical protein
MDLRLLLRATVLTSLLSRGLAGVHSDASAAPLSPNKTVRPARIASPVAPVRLPLHFEAHPGESGDASGTTFLSRNPAFTLSLSASGAAVRPRSGRGRDAAPLRMTLVGGNAKARPSGTHRMPGRMSYFVGNDPNGWERGLPTYARVRYRAVYPGIDLVYYGNGNELEYDFIIAPGADPSAIRLRFGGVDKVGINARGELEIRHSGGTLTQKKPVLYQEVHGTRKPVWGRYLLHEDGAVGFEVGPYDPDRTLVIDPVLQYASYAGGDNSDSVQKVAVDADGNLFLLLQTQSGTEGRGRDVFLMKLNPAGDQLLAGAFLGGRSDEYGNGLALDAAGNVYVTGLTFSEDNRDTPDAYEGFPVTQDAYLTTYGRTFVAKLNPALDGLVYSTYFKSTEGYGIAVDGTGNIYITGEAPAKNWFVTTPGAFQQENGCSIFGEPFVAKLNPNAAGEAGLVYSTYLSGSACGKGYSVLVDGDGSAYVTGDSGNGFPTTEGAPQKAYGGYMSDAFVAKLNPAGSALVYATYLGGEDFDVGWSLALGSDRSLYVTGTAAMNFPTTPGAFQKDWNLADCDPDPLRMSACSDAFVAKLTPSGSLAYSTFLGGTSKDYGRGIAVDADGNAYVTGYTMSWDFPTAHPLQKDGGGTDDVFVSVLNPAGSALLFSTYLGGSSDDSGSGIALDRDGSIYVGGESWSENFPVHRPLQEKPTGREGIFFKIGMAPAPGSVKGDADLDGALNVSDAVTVLKAAVGELLPTPEQVRAADVNGDTRVDVQDAVKILKVIVGTDTFD